MRMKFEETVLPVFAAKYILVLLFRSSKLILLFECFVIIYNQTGVFSYDFYMSEQRFFWIFYSFLIFCRKNLCPIQKRG